MSVEAKEKPHYIHYASYVPDLVPAEDKTDDEKKVTCEACRQTLKENTIKSAQTFTEVLKTKRATDGSNDVVGGIVLPTKKRQKA